MEINSLITELHRFFMQNTYTIPIEVAVGTVSFLCIYIVFLGGIFWLKFNDPLDPKCQYLKCSDFVCASQRFAQFLLK